MAKSNALTAAKARIKTLEATVNAQHTLNAAAAEGQRRAESAVWAVKEQAGQALATAQQSLSDLQSVNAELRDACEEIQGQRNKAQHDARTYRLAFWILFTLTAIGTAIDAVFYWSILS